MARCFCGCHWAAGEIPHPLGIEVLDNIARLTACSRCRNEHWRAFYLATEPKPPAPKVPEPWVEPPRSDYQGEDGG